MNKSLFQPYSQKIALIALMVLSFVLAIIDCQQLEYYHHGENMKDLYDATSQLLEGHTQTLAYQNRVLPQYVIKAIQEFRLPDYAIAYKRYVFLSYLIMHLVLSCILVKRKIRLSVSTFLLVCFAGAQTLFLDFWWMPWTNMEEIFFLLLFMTDEIFTGCIARWISYLGIFAMWVFTKETALFVPIYIFLRQAINEWANESIELKKLIPLGSLCAVLIIVSQTIVTMLRHHFWKSSIFPGSGEDLGGHTTFLHQHFMMPENIGYLIKEITVMPHLSQLPDWPNGGYLFLVFASLFIGTLVSGIRERNSITILVSSLGVTFVGIATVFAHLAEADVILPIVPIGFYLVINMVFTSKDHIE